MECKVNLKEIRDQFYQYVLGEHAEDIQEILKDSGDTSRHIPIYVNFLTLSESCPLLTDVLRSSGSQVLPALDLALARATRHLYGQLTDAGHHGLSLKTRPHVRLIELPVCAELQRSCVPRIDDEGQLLCVSGTVVRAGLPHMLETRAHYTCNKCGHQFALVAEYEQSYQTERPVRCPNPQKCRAGSGFTPATAGDASLRDHQARDYQEIRLQEQVQKLDVGKIPRGLCVVLEDDLVDSCKAGDDVIITGTVRQRWRSAVRGSPPDIEMTLHANRVFVNSEQRASLLLTDERRRQFDEFWRCHRHDPMAGRNRILQSFCSQIYGMYVVKLAVALTLAGGVRRVDTTCSTRGEPHLLLIGDPGTGKSQLLKYAARLSARSVLTTGIGSSSAGLTCAAVKEGAEWQLEAGALVLADGGVCCIDEFSSVREADKTSIHEAMEQQTISVAKAGMVCKLNTRCSVLAAANPRQPVDWDSEPEPLSKLGLGSPLLSRFDLILVLKDARSHGWDKLVSGYILSGLDPLSCHGEPASAAEWGLETLQAYLAHVRRLQPQPDRSAAAVLQRYYQLVRASETAGRCRTTVRLLESLVRLSQAHARLRCSPAARLCDAVVAVTLMEASLGGLGGGLLGPDGVGSILHTAFPESAADEYRAQCELILGRLGLDELLELELAALDEQRRLAADDAAGSGGEDELADGREPAPGQSGCSDWPGTDPPSGGAGCAPPTGTAPCGMRRVSTVSGTSSDGTGHAPRPTGTSPADTGRVSGTTDTLSGGTRHVSGAADILSGGTKHVSGAADTLSGGTKHVSGATDTSSDGIGQAPSPRRQGPLPPGAKESPTDGRLGSSLERTTDTSANPSLASVLRARRDCSVRRVGADRRQTAQLGRAGSGRTGAQSGAGPDSLTRIRASKPRAEPGPPDRAAADAERPASLLLSRFKYQREPAAAAGAAGRGPRAAPTLTASLDSLADDMEDDFESSLRDRAAAGLQRPPPGRRAAPGACRRGASTPAEPSRPDGGPPEPADGAGSADAGRRPLSASTRQKLAKFSADAGPAWPPSRDGVSAPPDGVTAVPRDPPPAAEGAGGPAAAAAGCSWLDSSDEDFPGLDLDISWPPAKRVKS